MTERFIYVAAALALLILMSVLDGPTESDAAAAVALDLNDAITAAKLAANTKDHE